MSHTGRMTHLFWFPLPRQVRLAGMVERWREPDDAAVERPEEAPRGMCKEVDVVLRRSVEEPIDLLTRNWGQILVPHPAAPREQARVERLLHDLVLEALERLASLAVDGRHMNPKKPH